MRLNVSLLSSLRGPHRRPWLSSQYERFSFGDPHLVQAWLAMPHGSWPTPARRQDGVASYGAHLAVSHTIFRTEEGTPERQRLASSYSWYGFPGLSHLSRLEARVWLLKDNCAPCDSGSARVNPSLRAPELGPHLYSPYREPDYQYPLYVLLPASHVRPRHISKAWKPSAKGSLWSYPSLPPVGRKADLHQAKSSPPERLALMLGHVAVDRPVMVTPSRCSGH
jgi:hypothetical protein